eukprot:scaffold8462_cov64-Phaeocystis_antarctica.AAC.4
MRGRLLELRYRARSRPPSSTSPPTQHLSPHAICCPIVRRRPDNPRRQRLEPLVVPPLRLGHLGALLLPQQVEGACRGILHVVPRGGERCTEVHVRRGLVGPQGDGLAVGLACFAQVLLRGVPRALSQQFRVRVARLRGAPGQLLRRLAIPLLPHPTILIPLPLLPQLLVKHPVQLPSGRVRRAVDAAEVCRRQLLIEALIADGVLLTLVVHV